MRLRTKATNLRVFVFSWLHLIARATATLLLAQSTPGVISGPVGPSPYDVVRGWHKPFSEPGFAFGGNSGVFAESPNRIFVAQRGEFRLPDPVPPGFAGFAGSIGVNVLSATAGRVWQQLPLHARRATATSRSGGRSGTRCARDRPAPGRIGLRISPYDPEHRVWVVNETFNTIYVFSNDGSKLLKTLGEKNVPGSDGTHFGKPQDVAFLPDGRILIADGLDNHRVMILDSDMNYLAEFGGQGKGPGPVQRRARDRRRARGTHLRARSIGRPHQRVQDDGRSGEGRVRRGVPRLLAAARHHRQRRQPLGDRSQPAPVHQARLPRASISTPGWCRRICRTAISRCTRSRVDSNGNLYGGDNQYGRTQKFVPKAGADPALLIGRRGSRAEDHPPRGFASPRAFPPRKTSGIKESRKVR